MTADLIEFLRARLDDDDEEVARGAEPHWTRPGYRAASVLGIEFGFGPAAAIFAGRHDPARVLAEVDAKRRILALHDGEHDCPLMVMTGVYPNDWPTDVSWGKAGDRWAHPAVEHFADGEPCSTVRLLALPYADHLDYRPEWAPQ